MRRSSPTSSPDTRIAVDVGGTFTDLVLLESGRVAANVKVLTTPADPSLAVEAGIGRLEGLRPASVREVIHGTTLVANALIERKGATTALIATRGFRDVMTFVASSGTTSTTSSWRCPSR